MLFFIVAFSSSTTEEYYLSWESEQTILDDVMNMTLEYFAKKGFFKGQGNIPENWEDNFNSPAIELKKRNETIWVSIFTESNNQIRIHWRWAQGGCDSEDKNAGALEVSKELLDYLGKELDHNFVIHTENKTHN